MQRKPDIQFTTAEQAEIYIRAVLRGLSEGVSIGICCAAAGYFLGTFYGAAFGPVPDPMAIESAFCTTEAITGGLRGALYAGAAGALFSFFPAVKHGINEGFEKGPKAVNPLSPFHAMDKDSEKSPESLPALGR